MFKQAIRRLPDHVFDSKKFIERQLSSKGGHPTKLLTVDDAIQFIMVLPGQTAKVVRQQFAVIIRHHFAGDQSLHAEIDANDASSHPMAQMARESLNVQTIDKPALGGFKRRREELELLKMEHERVSSLAVDYEKMCTNTTLDEQAKTAFKATYLNLLSVMQAVPVQDQDKKKIKQAITAPDDRLLKRFLSTLTDTIPSTTKLTARDLHKKYMDYHIATGGTLATMLTETGFCLALKNITGVFKKRNKSANVYTIDHVTIQQSLLDRC